MRQFIVVREVYAPYEGPLPFDLQLVEAVNLDDLATKLCPDDADGWADADGSSWVGLCVAEGDGMDGYTIAELVGKELIPRHPARSDDDE